jgi:hypothetical protein
MKRASARHSKAFDLAEHRIEGVGGLSELLGLLSQGLDLHVHEVGLDLHDLRHVPGVHQLLRKFERGRDVLFGELHRLRKQLK